MGTGRTIALLAAATFGMGPAACKKADPPVGATWQKAVLLPLSKQAVFGDLHLRTETPESDVLLLRLVGQSEDFYRTPLDGSGDTPIVRHDDVYRYGPGGDRLERVTLEEWDRATGSIADGRENPTVVPYRFDWNQDSLSIGGWSYTAAGKSVLGVGASPDGRLLAVMSGEGARPRGPDMIFGRTPAPGRRFHELVRLSDRARVAEPVVIPFDRSWYDYKPRWSADGRYIVYTDNYFRSVCIVRNQVFAPDE